MVNNVTSLTGNGLRDWIFQRVSAIILAAYTLFLLGYFVCTPPQNFAAWQGLFQHVGMKIATVLALLSILIHSWVGMWTVSTDYLKCTCLRLSFQIAMIVSLIAALIWGIIIVWSV